jgi:hypothetical protein
MAGLVPAISLEELRRLAFIIEMRGTSPRMTKKKH